MELLETKDAEADEKPLSGFSKNTLASSNLIAFAKILVIQQNSRTFPGLENEIYNFHYFFSGFAIYLNMSSLHCKISSSNRRLAVRAVPTVQI